MQLKKLPVLLIGASLLLSGCSVSSVSTETTTVAAGATEETVKSIRAEDDYYGYVNLATLKDITVEYGETQAGSFSSIDIKQQLIDATLRVVNSNETFPEGSCEQIVRDAYQQYIVFATDDTAKSKACQEIETELGKIRDASSLEDLMQVAAELKAQYGCGTFSELSVGIDAFNPDAYGISLNQWGELCGVPLEKVSENAYLGKEYEKRIIDTLQVMGRTYEEAEVTAHNLMLLIIDIARATDYVIANSSNPYAYTTFMSDADIEKSMTNLTGSEFEQMSGIRENPYGGWLVIDKGQLAAFDAVWIEENLEELKAMAAYNFLDQYGSFITSKYSLYEEYFPESHEQMDLQAVKFINDTFPRALSDLYVKEYYTEGMDQQFTQMCEDIRSSYRDLITNADYLSEGARQLLLQKLENIRFLTGRFCLEQMKNDPGMSAVFGESIFETRRNVASRNVQTGIDNIGNPRDRMEFSMSMQSVNACYSFDNTVTITVAIMSAPFFDESADYYTNLGGLGAVVAHEVGHAFDSDMIKYNANGVYDPSWLSVDDMASLEARNKVAVEYFEKYFPVFDVYHVDGSLTLGENYADLGGMECITNLCRTKDNYTKLFENYATIWCEYTLNTDVIEQLYKDSHSPATIRVNAILATTDAFYEVYDVKEGDGMYIAPENRISRWS